jgi:hypothetical protein
LTITGLTAKGGRIDADTVLQPAGESVRQLIEPDLRTRRPRSRNS